MITFAYFAASNSIPNDGSTFGSKLISPWFESANASTFKLASGWVWPTLPSMYVPGL